MTAEAPPADPFLAELVERERSSQLTAERFAHDVLRVSPGLWSRTKRGQRNVGATLIRGALRAFPELAVLLSASLTTGNADRKANAA